METLLDVWMTEWERYSIDPWFLFIGLAVAAVFAYRDWQRTLLVLWSVVYLWSMVTILSPNKLDMGEGFIVVWVCGYGLLGFFFLGFLIYNNLK